MAESAAASGIGESHSAMDALLADMLELHEAETARAEERKHNKVNEQREDDRADEAMIGMKKRSHDFLPSLMTHIEERDALDREVELRKVANEERRLAIESELIKLERGEKGGAY
ncbi:hypothetical protein BBJ28_00024082 [Nothophytophthora sp. Chile5]|nr:hypothetical protein BBJ28_00024082 [Nothophytophthora sp. Chile5]